MQNQPILIEGGRLMDPSIGRDEIADLFIVDGHLAETPRDLPHQTSIIKAAGLVVTPGFTDLHVHLREPGGERAETIESGSRAAARGGFTTVVAMPNTRPPLDTPERIAWVKQRGQEVGIVRVIPCGCVTANREGKKLADLKALAEAGAGAFTDDGSTVQSDELMRQALETTRDLRLPPIMDHAQDREIERRGGVMHEGAASRAIGLPGIPSWAEEKTVRRDIALAEQSGSAVHIQHVTTRESVDLIRSAQGRGVKVSGEVTPHHLVFIDEDVDPLDARFKMNPPLRGQVDREALRAAIVDGTLIALATDHAPHPQSEKDRGFLQAPFGVIGLETAVGVTYTELVLTGRLDLLTWVRRWTTGPAQILNLPAPALREGQPADLVVLDLDNEWVVDPKKFLSHSGNSPFIGRRLRGRARCTILGGRVTWNAQVPSD